MSNHLFPLPPGSTINIGRKLSCNVVVDSNLVSNLHCKLTITSDPPFKATLLDCSRNGTWIQRASEVNGTSASTSTKKSSSAQKAEKLKNGGDVKELHDGDSILLLAPSHKMTSSHRYKLIRGDDGKLLLEKLSSNGTSDATTASKRKKSEAEGARMTPTKKRKMESPDGADGGAAAVKVSKSATGKPNAHTVLTKEEENEMGRCPTCRKLFHISVLPIHCPICQECPHELCEDTTTTTTMEECVFCSKIFLTGDLAAHHEVCEGETVKRSLEQIGECPKCSVILPINELIEHSAKCRAPAKPIHLAGTIQSSSSEPCEEMEVDGAKMLISAARDGPGVGPAAGPAAGLSTTLELEQCAFCLQDFPVCDMPDHYSQCTTKSKVSGWLNTLSSPALHFFGVP